MKEIAEFRIDEEFAGMLFGTDEGKRVGSSVRRVELEVTDNRYEHVGRMQSELRATLGKPFFFGWDIRRQYTKLEIATADLFSLRVRAIFEPAGEERGTKYDESTSCPRCGSGAQQIGPLILDVRRIPKNKDFAKTIAGEIIVSRKVYELFAQHQISGVAMSPVRISAASSAESSDWFQLRVLCSSAEVISPTRAGNNPFDEDLQNEGRCAHGDLLGLNLLSELTISAVTRGEADVLSSRQFIGVRRGLLRPERSILIAPRVWRLIESESLKGVEVEIARLG